MRHGAEMVVATDVGVDAHPIRVDLLTVEVESVNKCGVSLVSVFVDLVYLISLMWNFGGLL